jgi:hypothetical protein
MIELLTQQLTWVFMRMEAPSVRSNTNKRMLVRLPFRLYKCTLFVLNTAACAPSFCTPYFPHFVRPCVPFRCSAAGPSCGWCCPPPPCRRAPWRISSSPPPSRSARPCPRGRRCGRRPWCQWRGSCTRCACTTWRSPAATTCSKPWPPRSRFTPHKGQAMCSCFSRGRYGRRKSGGGSVGL